MGKFERWRTNNELLILTIRTGLGLDLSQTETYADPDRLRSAAVAAATIIEKLPENVRTDPGWTEDKLVALARDLIAIDSKASVLNADKVAIADAYVGAVARDFQQSATTNVEAFRNRRFDVRIGGSTDTIDGAGLLPKQKEQSAALPLTQRATPPTGSHVLPAQGGDGGGRSRSGKKAG